MKRGNLRTFIVFFLGLSLLSGLYLTSRHNYLLFHGLAELFSIIVAFSIFVIAWNSRKIIRSNYLLFLGVAYLFVGAMDLLHTLSYTGMGVFPAATTNLPTQLWIAARYMESTSLLIAPLIIKRKLRAEVDFTVYSVIFALLLGSIFYWNIFPECFVEGVGLTAFKKISEYIIVLILVASIFIIFLKREAFDRHVLRLLVASIIITIFSEFCFTLYASAYAPANALGHFLKIISFYLIYQALIHTGLEKPYTLLFRELKQSEEKFRLAFENAKDAIFWADPQSGTLINCNSAAEKMIGRPREEILGKLQSILHPPDTSEYYKSIFRKHLEEAGAVNDEAELITRSGEIVPVLISASLTTVGGKPVLQGIFHDITERKRIENELRKSETRYRQLSERLEEIVQEKVAELKQAEQLAAIGQMVSVVAHEVRNPLQNIRFGVEFLREKMGTTKEHLELIEEVESGISLLDDVVVELLNYAKPVSLEYARIPVGDLIRHSLNGLSNKLDNINVTLSIEQEQKAIVVDANRIKRVLMNFILNAAEAMPGGGDLAVSCGFSGGESDGMVKFSIKDTGCGISEDDLKRIEEPFFTTKTQGTGLGIPICMKIIEAHNGSWTLKSTVNEGTTIEIILPVHGALIDGKLGHIVI